MTENVIIDNRPVLITFRYWHELNKAAVLTHLQLEEFLSSKMILSEYGCGLSAVRISFVCINYATTNHGDKTKFYVKLKELYFVRQLPYDIFNKLTNEEAVKMQAQVFLAALEKVKNRKKQIPDFDFHRFYADVEKLFKEKNWI